LEIWGQYVYTVYILIPDLSSYNLKEPLKKNPPINSNDILHDVHVNRWRTCQLHCKRCVNIKLTILIIFDNIYKRDEFKPKSESWRKYNVSERSDMGCPCALLFFYLNNFFNEFLKSRFSIVFRLWQIFGLAVKWSVWNTF